MHSKVTLLPENVRFFERKIVYDLAIRWFAHISQSRERLMFIEVFILAFDNSVAIGSKQISYRILHRPCSKRLWSVLHPKEK